MVEVQSLSDNASIVVGPDTMRRCVRELSANATHTLHMRTTEEFKDIYLTHLRNLVDACRRIDDGDLDARAHIAVIVHQLVCRERMNVPVLSNLSGTGLSASLEMNFLSTARWLDASTIGAGRLVVVCALQSQSQCYIWYSAQYTDNAPSYQPGSINLVPVRSLPVDLWLSEPVVFLPNSENSATASELSRRDVVNRVRNKDGGAHTDAELPVDYAELTRGRLGFDARPGQIRDPGIEFAFQKVAFARRRNDSIPLPGTHRARSVADPSGLPGLVAPIAKHGVVASTLRQIAHELLLTLIAADPEIAAELDYVFPDFQMQPKHGPGGLVPPVPPIRRSITAVDWIRNWKGTWPSPQRS